MLLDCIRRDAEVVFACRRWMLCWLWRLIWRLVWRLVWQGLIWQGLLPLLLPEGTSFPKRATVFFNSRTWSCTSLRTILLISSFSRVARVGIKILSP